MNKKTTKKDDDNLVSVTVIKDGWRRGGGDKTGPGELQPVGEVVQVPKNEAEFVIKRGIAE